jgi:4-amino-4-deoxy-L-arabinose transferase-like glycosyltransferase
MSEQDEPTKVPVTEAQANEPATPAEEASPDGTSPSGAEVYVADAAANEAPASPKGTVAPDISSPESPSMGPELDRDAFDIVAGAVGDLVAGSSGLAVQPSLIAHEQGEASEPATEPDAGPDTSPLPGPNMTEADRTRPMEFFDKSLWKDWPMRASIVVIFITLYFYGLGSFGLWDPWEVHYGAVGWGLIERGDWISPWWGSYWTGPEDRAMEGSYFFSKPILLLWMMGLGMQAFGFNEFGIRFGVALIAVLGVCSVYLMGSKVWNRKVGLLMSLCLGTSPFFAMLGRQAQTDMPFVGLMTVALSFFMMGVFGQDRSRKADKFSWGLFVAFLTVVVIPQLHTITVGQLAWDYRVAADASTGQRVAQWLETFFCYGPTQLGIYIVLVILFVVTQIRQKNTTRGQLYLYVFYAFVGLATMGKGILGFALPGAIILIYLLVSREWGLLKRVELGRGIIVTILVGMPWYGAVFARHDGIGGAWWNGFIIHDHFKRLASGVHQIDTGSFEHFVKWLAYGLFPWGSFVPAIIARALNGQAGDQRTDKDRARLFLFIWFAIAFTLFTLSSTKFHHYIFPAVPALAMLVALLLNDLHDGKISFQTWWPLWVAAAAVFILVGFDLMNDPQHLKNMFTYKYDRRWDHDAWDPEFKSALRVFFGVSAVGMLLLIRSRVKPMVTAGIGILLLNGLVMTAWALNVYMPSISSTWSQKGVWDTYYELCTPGDPPPGTHPMKADRYCVDSIITYKLVWRGETFYSMNEVIPIREDSDWNYFREHNGDRCYYALMERARVSAFRNAVPADQRDSVVEEHHDNIKFMLLSINCRSEEEVEALREAERAAEAAAEAAEAAAEAMDGSGEAEGSGEASAEPDGSGEDDGSGENEGSGDGEGSGEDDGSGENEGSGDGDGSGEDDGSGENEGSGQAP